MFFFAGSQDPAAAAAGQRSADRAGLSQLPPADQHSRPPDTDTGASRRCGSAEPGGRGEYRPAESADQGARGNDQPAKDPAGAAAAAAGRRRGRSPARRPGTVQHKIII